MIKRYLFSIISVLTTFSVEAKYCFNDSTSSKANQLIVANSSSVTYRNFDQLFVPANTSSADPIIIPDQLVPDSIQLQRSKALEYEQEVTSRNALIHNLNALSLLTLPVGLQRTIGSLNYTVIISRIESTPKGTFLEAYLMLELPQSGDKIAFRGTNIPFSNTGGFTGVGRLELIGNYPIAINDKTLFTLLGKGNSFVEFDCNGFKGIGLEGEVEFSRDMIIPEDDLGKTIPEPARVKTKFTTYAQSWSDILIGINIPTFQVNGLKDVGFSVQQAFLDWSDLSNPPGLLFPQEYPSPFIESGQHALWQGIFLQRLDIRLPPSFSKRNGSGRVTFGIENAILDDQGFTGTAFAENVLQAGNMNGWAYTIDRVGLELVVNQLKGFDLAGKISVPKIKQQNSDKATSFGYLAQRTSDGNYLFAVKVEDKVRLPLLIAEVHLFRGSSIIVKEKDSKFYPTANLNGELTIKGVGKGVKANFANIRFEGMRISSENPRFDIQALGFGKGEGQSVSGFPVQVRNIMVRKSGTDKLGLGFDLVINIGGKSSEEGFGGGASLIVWGKESTELVKDAEGQVIDGEKEWKFDKVEISGVTIDIKKTGAFELAGTILFFNEDPVYGDGFKGTLTGSISMFGGIKAEALFGKTPTFRYWYADALVKLETGVPLIPGALFATGFGGGFYSKMKQTAESQATTIGLTKSGVYYVPDENTMGIKAIMEIGTARPEAMNGNVGLEVVLNRHGGINSVTLTGNANFMSFAKLAESKMKELASAGASGKLSEKLAGMMKGQVFGSMKLHFDNENDVFHGNLEIYINVAGGIVKGIGEGSRAGWAVLHFERKDWYVLIGTPDQPIGLEVAKLFKAKSYFMLGMHLPGSPPPPQQVSEILGNIDLDYMRDMNALQSGFGFAFGLHFIVDTGDLRFLMFYGRFAAGTGVDFMLKDYGTQYHCQGSSGAMGINGWYANGQAYAFVMGKIGIKVNLRFYKGNFDILSIGAAAILQAKGPNPFWMKGVVGGYYKILGGMVKGQCKFEVTVGKDCKPVGQENVLDDVKMIAEISPASNSNNVDVFNTPQVAFNIPVGEEFEVRDDQNRMHYFRAKLDEFTVMNGYQRIQGVLQWNDEHDVVIFDGFDILPGEKELKARARLTFEEKKNGTWVKVRFQNKIVEEVAETTFKTDKAPDYIPANNVSLSYPISGQLNFFPNEYNKGFIQLKDGQPYLFNADPAWIQKVRMTNANGDQYVETELTYDQQAKKVNFTIPSGFQNAKVYRFEILNIPRQKTVIDANVQKVETELTGDAGTATLTTKEIEGQLDKLDIKSIYSSTFRTSKYNTFVDKMRNIKLGDTYRENKGILIFQLMTYMTGDEMFDAAEVSGLNNADKLIRMEAILPGNAWYENHAYPLLYEGYPLYGWMTVKRPANELGVPPIRAIDFEGFSQKLILKEGELNFIPPSFNNEYIGYNLGEAVANDYYAIQQHAVNYYVKYPAQLTSRLESLILKAIPYIRYGRYRFKFNYVVPGSNTINSSYEMEFFNKVPDSE